MGIYSLSPNQEKGIVMASLKHIAWSGHYMSYVLNVQAICDSNCCFPYFGVVAPGKCSNQKTFERT
jgi:hypothetical protein